MTRRWLCCASLAFFGAGCMRAPARAEVKSNPDAAKAPSEVTTMSDKVRLSDEEWRKRLTGSQYQVLRLKGTEPPFTGAYWDSHDEAVYVCAGCGAVLFTSKEKFDSGTGWPSFYDMAKKGVVELETDSSHGMVRTEVHCARCGGHLGHLFDDGPSPTGLRYCINSAALKKEPGKAP